MPLGMDVGVSPGDFVLDGDAAPPSNFRPMSIVAKQLDGFKMPLGPEVGPDNIVLDGGPAPSIRGTAPNFRPMSIVAKRFPISPTAELLFL